MDGSLLFYVSTLETMVYSELFIYPHLDSLSSSYSHSVGPQAIIEYSPMSLVIFILSVIREHSSYSSESAKLCFSSKQHQEENVLGLPRFILDMLLIH